MGEGRTEISFIARHRSRIVALALVGAAVGVALGFLAPSSYRSEAGVLITRFATTETDIAEALDDEARFVNAVVVRDRVRNAIPDAPDRVDVEVDVDASIVRIRVHDDTPDKALRLAREWSSSYIAARRTALIARLDERSALNEAELARLVDDIGRARLAGDDVAAAQLEQRRDTIAADQAVADNDLAALTAGAGAEVVESPERATDRSGIALVPTAFLGLLAGGFIGAALGALRDRKRRRSTEARAWLPNDAAPDLASPDWQATRQADVAPAASTVDDGRGLGAADRARAAAPAREPSTRNEPTRDGSAPVAPGAAGEAAGFSTRAPSTTAAAAPPRARRTVPAQPNRIDRSLGRHRIAPRSTGDGEPLRVVAGASGGRVRPGPDRDDWDDDFSLVDD